MPKPIPVQNLYYLLCYAWQEHPDHGVLDSSTTDYRDLHELLGRLLVDQTRRLLRRGVQRDYVEHTEEVSRLRGRVDLLASKRGLALERGRAICQFDELSPDILINQILRATFRRLLVAAPGLPAGLQRELRQLSESFWSVKSIRLTRRHFRLVRLHRNNRPYRWPIRLCSLLHDLYLPDDGGRGGRFLDLSRDKAKMDALFEKYVRSFAARHRPDLSNNRGLCKFPFLATGESEHVASLPRMETDVSLAGAAGRCIIDCKHYGETLQPGKHGGASKVHSGHLYQLLAYLHHQPGNQQHGGTAGMLLYPHVDCTVSLDFQMHGRRVMVRTINLDGPWREIETDMLRILRAAVPSVVTK